MSITFFNLKILKIYFLYLLIIFVFIKELSLVSEEVFTNEDRVNNLVYLESIKPNNCFKDLEPLKTILKDAQIIALGEATHGTREFFQCKHRMLEFFVREMGCRYLMIEASYANCLKINEYVLYGKEDRNTVLSEQGFSSWNTEEVAEMLDWMHYYNQTASAEDKVQFLGFDCQMSEGAGEILCSLIEKGNPEFLNRATTIFSSIKGKHALMIAEQSYLLQFKTQLQEVHEYLISSKNKWESSIKDHQHALFLVRLLKQECDYCLIEKNPYSSIQQYINTHAPQLKQIFDEQGPEIFFMDEMISKYPDLEKCIDVFVVEQSLRDFYMGENIISLLDSIPQGNRIMVWAHNGHIALDKCEVYSMGSVLKQKLGPKYYSIGFTTSFGTFQALEITDNTDNNMELKIFDLPPQPEDSWAFFCSQLGDGKNFFLDFCSSSNQWLSTPHFLLSLGNSFSTQWKPECFLAKLIPIKYFDGLIYLHQTSTARPISYSTDVPKRSEK